jgi:hypothetical protein
MNTEQQIRQRIDNFVRDLQALLVDAAKESLMAALGGAAPVTRGASRKAAARPARGRKAAAGGRVRRSTEQLAEVQDKVLGALNKNPGMTSEEIQDALGLEKKDLQRPLTLLREEKRVKTKGQRRGMKYFAT